MPTSVNLETYYGDSWSQKFRFRMGTTPLPLLGATVEAQAVEDDSRNPQLYNLVAEVSDPLVGEITISMPDPPLPPGNYLYDVEVTDSSMITTTWVKGRLYVEPDVGYGVA